MKKVIQILFLLLGVIVVLSAIYFLVERILSRMTAQVKPSSGEKNITVYIMSNGVHTDIVLPVQHSLMDWSVVFPYGNTVGKDNHYTFVGIGWGDKGFYLDTPEWKDLKVSTAFVAATGIGETALHVTYHKRIEEDSLTFKYRINAEQYQALIDYIKGSLDYDGLHQAILIETNAQYSDSDAFYEATGSYSMFHSCNTWTNNGLKQANMPASVWATLDKGLLSHYGYK